MTKKIYTLFLFFIPLFSHAQFQKHLKIEDDSLGYYLGQSFIKENDSISVSLANEIDSLWSGKFSYQEKKDFLGLIKNLDSTGYKPRPHFYKLIGTMVSAINNGKDLNKLIHHVSEYNKRDFPKEHRSNYFQTLWDLYDDGFIRKERKFKIKLINPNFSFSLPELIVETEETDFETEEAEEVVYGESFEDSGDYSDEWQSYEDNEEFNESEESLADFQNTSFIEAYSSEPLTELEGVILDIETTDLQFIIKEDTFTIKGTKGKYSPAQKIFLGEGGIIDWTMAGLSPDSVSCQLKKYELNLETTNLKSQKAKLTYVDRIDNQIEGELLFKLQDTSQVKNISYPRFKSYYGNHNIKNVGGENISFHGGFSLKGKKMSNEAVIEHVASALCSYENEEKFILKSKLFDFTDSTLNSENAKLKIFHRRDSIFHPSLNIKYQNQDTLLTAKRRPKSSYALSPFIASYFHLDVKADYLRWKYNSDSLEISILNAKSFTPAFFESRDYFNQENLDGLSKGLTFHPLYLVHHFQRIQNSNEFYILDLVTHYKLNEKIVKNTMKKLREHNFINYDEYEGKIVVLEKTNHYIYAKNNKKDFDDLSIASRATEGANTIINLKEDHMIVRGIHKFHISKKLNVYIEPKDNNIKILKNRDFKFDGQLFSGIYEFIGKDFTFKYDDFLVNLEQIDSIKFHVKDTLNNAKTVDNKVVSKKENETNRQEDILSQTINQTFGTLYINKPDNKSGSKTFAKFPYFNSKKGAYMYFDHPDILDGSYDKSVYFEVPPFEVDSMSGDQTEAIGFDGKFVSGGIFPDIETRLHIMPDNSFGFEYVAPEGNLPLYGDKGNFSSKIRLDKEGISGQGNIKYLTTTLESDNFIFYPDSVSGEGKKAVVEAIESNGVSYPDLQTSDYKMLWKPNQDSLFIYNQDSTLMRLYGETAKLDGAAVISKSGVYGTGLMTTRGTETVSENYSFKKSEFSARNAEFTVTTKNPDKHAVEGEDVKLMFNIAGNYADISPEKEGDAAISFPYTKFKSSISKARWDLAENTISMTKPEEVDISQSYFYSTKPELDSLVFYATDADYNMNSQEMTVRGIPYIKVADAKIIPDQNEIKIYEDANIENLNNAQLLLDTLNEYHHLVNGEIEIESRHKFYGKATYRYVNAVKDTFDIKFDDFRLEEEIQKRGFLSKKRKPIYHTASGGIALARDKVLLSPSMFYKGDLKMMANKKALELDGYVKLNLKHNPEYDTWIEYQNTDGNKNKISFDYETTLTEDGENLLAGVFFNQEFIPYVVFAGEKQNEEDQSLFSPQGMLHYDEDRKVLAIEDTLKTNQGSYAGKTFTYSEEKSKVSFEGEVQLLDNRNPSKNAFDLKIVGSSEGEIEDEKIKMNILSIFKMQIPENALLLMADKIIQYNDIMGGSTAEANRSRLYYKMAEIVGDTEVLKYKESSQGQYISLPEFSDKFIKPLVVSNLDLNWSKENKAWHNKGKVGISNILNKDVNTLTEGYFEIKKTSEGDVVSLFFKFNSRLWFYFEFDAPNNSLSTLSSLSDYNAIIEQNSKASDGIGSLNFGLSDLSNLKSHLNQFTYDYLDAEEDYQLDMPTEKSIVSDSDDSENLLEEESNLEESEDDIFEDEEELPKTDTETQNIGTKQKPKQKTEKDTESKPKEETDELLDESSSEEEEIFGDEDDGF